MRQPTMERKHDRRNSVLRVFMAALAITLQIVWLWMIFGRLGQIRWADEVIRVFAVFLVLWIYGRHQTAGMKIPWIMLILVMPVFGVFFYLLIGLSGGTFGMRRRFAGIDEELAPILAHHRERIGELDELDRRGANIARYVERYSGYPLYRNTDITFYPMAAEALRAQKQDLRQAKRFIFMEYHAIEDAQVFASIHEILAQKVREGVEVRIFYDDIGSATFLTGDFRRRMERDGIQCRVFNPVGPFLNIFLNNRDHRKITVIDGEIGYTGGYNLANEYFGVTHPYGVWKDTGVRLQGDAVRSLTCMFLQMWNAIRDSDRDDRDLEKYVQVPPYHAAQRGFVQPYADTPLDDEQVGENVYMEIISQARDYVWFITPYLILSDEMISALRLAARRGVDVRIVTPGIPDKRIIYAVTRSYYGVLVRGGVRIYEYTPGFCHAKQCLSDDKIAVCGTINLDYRSFYHHFEDGCLFSGTPAVMDMRRDFEHTFAESTEVTAKYASRTRRLRTWQCILRVISGML